jgi:hypothetical protein
VRIFVGYHYGPSDAWVENCVIPLVEAFGDKVIVGKHVDGFIGDSIPKRVGECDAMVGVAGCREKLEGQDFYDTHLWVQQELEAAKSAGKLWIQLRHRKVSQQFGTLTGTSYIDYDESTLHLSLVELAKVLSEWHSRRNADVRLLPEAFVKAVAPYVKNPELIVEYEVCDENGDRKRTGNTRLRPMEGSLRVTLNQVASGEYIQLTVRYRNKQWRSEYFRIDSQTAFMSEDPPDP